MEWFAMYRPHGRVYAPAPVGGRVHQEFKNECDINVLMKRYQVTGVMPSTGRPPQYADVSSLPDLMTALNTVNAANEAFAALPALVRKRFSNDPAEFVQFAQDPSNSDELVKLGLATAKPVVPASTPVIPPETAD